VREEKRRFGKVGIGISYYLYIDISVVETTSKFIYLYLISTKEYVCSYYYSLIAVVFGGIVINFSSMKDATFVSTTPPPASE